MGKKACATSKYALGSPQGLILTFILSFSLFVFASYFSHGILARRGNKQGVCQYASGSRYEGLWLDGLRHGEGVFTSSAGEAQKGLWHRDDCVTPAAAAAAHEERSGATESLASLARQEEVAA